MHPNIEVREFKDELSALEFLISVNLFVKELSPVCRGSWGGKIKIYF